MTEPANPHFLSLETWDAAEPWIGFAPRTPRSTLGHDVESLAVFVRDHRMRDVAMERRSLEAHYGAFVFTQSRPGVDAAVHAVAEVAYGTAAVPVAVGAHEGRAYELGPEPPPDDSDPRMPAVVVWADGAMFFLVASEVLPVASLIEVARSVR